MTDGSPRQRQRRIGPAVAISIGLLLLALAAWAAYVANSATVVDVRTRSSSPTIGAVHFGGPDQPPGKLRALLLDHVRAAPPGSAIDWATYYFLDRELAEALIAASDRGVAVTLVVEGDPRFEGANDPVVALLARHGLDGGLTVRPASRPGSLHAKIYAFSHPRPFALVGSFNPSGGPTADPEVLEEIGDQDRGHNLLVEIDSPGLVGKLQEHVRELARNGGSGGRFELGQNTAYRDRDTILYVYPRVSTGIVEAEVDRLGKGDRLWAAVSHLDDTSVDAWADAARRGAELHIIVHHTERRVPQAAIDRLRQAGVDIRRYRDPEDLPMHAKFVLIERGGERVSFFGSFNFNRSSRFLNDELLVRSTDPRLFDTLRDRFDLLDAEVREQMANRPASP